MRLLIVLWLVGCSSAPVAHVPAPKQRPPRVVAPFPAQAPFRLPHTFEPVRYRVHLALGDKQLTGHVEIDGQVSEVLPLFWLHGVDVVVSRAVARRDRREVAIDASAPRADQVIGFRPVTPLDPGAWTIAIDYTAPIHDEGPPEIIQGIRYDSRGLGVFRRVDDGRSYIFTQGEAIHTRWYVPCIDEPDRKVPWQLTLVVAGNVVAASNTPIVRETPIDATHTRFEFAETKPLPSYLLAFAVGPFEVIEMDKSASGVPIRLLAIAGHSASITTAARNAPRLLDQYEQYLGVPYAYGKLDIVAVPRSGWGAMENPGLITFGQQYFESRDAASILSHEIAHQWFGDLVTMTWWDDIWLSESFAQFFAAGSPSDPVAARHRALGSLWFGMDVHAIAASNLDLVFGGFAPYPQLQKGEAILWLVAGKLGREKFRAAMHSYLTAHAHGNATTSDLFEVLGAEFVPLMTRGAPTIQASLRCTKTNRELVVRSSRTPVSVCVAYDQDGKRATTCAIVDADPTNIPLPARRCPTWVLPNADGTGVYRTNWTPLVEQLLARGWKHLTPDERRTVFSELDDTDDRKLALLARIDAEDPGSAEMASYLYELVRYVPADLRPHFDRWVRSHFAPVAPRAHLTVPSWMDVERVESAPVFVTLMLQVGDEALRKEAEAIAARFPGNVAEAFATPAAKAVAPHDPALVTRLFDGLASADSQVRARSIETLATLPNIADMLAKEPERFEKVVGFDRVHLVGNVCDPQSRKTIAPLFAGQQPAYDPLPDIDRCIARRKQLEPAFRAWLAPKRRK